MTEREILRLFGSPVNVIESARDLMHDRASGLTVALVDDDHEAIEDIRDSMRRTADRLDAALKRIKDDASPSGATPGA